VAIPGEQLPPESYAFHLSIFFADPADPGYQGDILPVVPGNEPVKYGDMGIVQRLLRDALRRAYDMTEPFFVPTRRGVAEIVTDDAGQWLLADPRYCELLPSDYRAFLERGSQPQVLPTPTAEPAPVTAESQGKGGNTEFNDTEVVDRARVLYRAMQKPSKRRAAAAVVDEMINAGKPINGQSRQAWIDRIRHKI
jgi:hypothetical protein